MKHCHGSTLVEQLAVLAISSILLGGAITGFDALSALRADHLTNTIQRHLQFARSLALSRNTSVFVCPSDDGSSCSKSWSPTLVVYDDSNGNYLLDNDDTVIRTVNIAEFNARIRWRAFGSRPYLQFVNTGLTNYHNGTYTICPQNGDLRLARNLIVNVAGRSYRGKDKNDNGILETASGKDINCPNTDET